MFMCLFCMFASYFVYSAFVLFCVLFLLFYICPFSIFVQVHWPLPPGGNPIAFNKYCIIYIISYRIIYHITSHHIMYHIASHRIMYQIIYHMKSNRIISNLIVYYKVCLGKSVSRQRFASVPQTTTGSALPCSVAG